ncbi:cell division protein ZapD [Pantoea sp. Nvir]|uniref:cell division protein ZapD n=1 Tax=Pantoea sp. Nvir TaxID=2576760 RepID=UPI00135A63C4|nr:cell division protein ZapD [Pantoea sp. Nvir]MXP66860.1 cell division protein ZapD [Pantoea sp. Nvir]CAJ0991297.1 Cell division protein ZapD [Pantoea sp. Nvir]
MSTVVLFEHPLNEKMRTWLRFEFLIQQLHETMRITHTGAALNFFRIMSELLDIFERGDMRTDLIKEIERQQQKLRSWADVPGVNVAVVDALHEKLRTQTVHLNRAPRMGRQLREDRLISSVRQRLNIPGGCCSFDLPGLHIWLHQPQEVRDRQVTTWLETLEPLNQSLAIILDLIRQSGTFRHQTSLNGFYQDNVEDADLLRLQLHLEDALYPQVSGHKSRYAIRFLPLYNECGEVQVPMQLNFELACC